MERWDQVSSDFFRENLFKEKFSIINFLVELDRSGEKVSEDEEHSSEIDEEETQIATSNTSRSSPLALSRLLSRSRGSLLVTEDSTKIERTTHQIIFLPKDYNPVSAIVQVETMHSFMNKINQKVYTPKMMNSDGLVNYKQVLFSSFK